ARVVRVVRRAVAREPAGELRVRVRAAPRSDLIRVGRIERELELQLVRRRDVERAAIAVVRHAIANPRAFEPALGLVEMLAVYLERDMREARFARMLGAESLVVLGLCELEERERAAVGERVEGVAVLELSVRFRVVRPFAPGRNERHPEQILEEAPVRFLVLRDPCVMM